MHNRTFTQAETAILLGLKRHTVRAIEASLLGKIRRLLGVKKPPALIGRPLIKCLK